jgi:hypothetical protein
MNSFAFRTWCFKTYKFTLKPEFNSMVMHTWTHTRLLNCSFIHCYHQNLIDIVLKSTLVQHRPPEMVRIHQHEGASPAPTHSPFRYIPLQPLLPSRNNHWMFVVSMTVYVIYISNMQNHIYTAQTDTLRLIKLEQM